MRCPWIQLQTHPQIGGKNPCGLKTANVFSLPHLGKDVLKCFPWPALLWVMHSTPFFLCVLASGFWKVFQYPVPLDMLFSLTFLSASVLLSASALNPHLRACLWAMQPSQVDLDPYQAMPLSVNAIWGLSFFLCQMDSGRMHWVKITVKGLRVISRYSENAD